MSMSLTLHVSWALVAMAIIYTAHSSTQPSVRFHYKRIRGTYSPNWCNYTQLFTIVYIVQCIDLFT